MIARVIVTLKCNKHCPYCCNRKAELLRSATVITSVDELLGRDIDMVLITGGEPLLDIPRTRRIVHDVRRVLPEAKLYLYTAIFNDRLSQIETEVDGIVYTVHQTEDVPEFDRAQAWLSGWQKSNWLSISPSVESITIQPGKWKRVKVKEWRADPILPPGEELFIVRE